MRGYRYNFTRFEGQPGKIQIASGSGSRVALIFAADANDGTRAITLGADGSFGTLMAQRTNTRDLNYCAFGSVLDFPISADNKSLIFNTTVNVFDIMADLSTWPPCDDNDKCLYSRQTFAFGTFPAQGLMVFPSNPTRTFLFIQVIDGPGFPAIWDTQSGDTANIKHGLSFFNEGKLLLKYKEIGPIVRDEVWIRGSGGVGVRYSIIETYY